MHGAQEKGSHTFKHTSPYPLCPPGAPLAPTLHAPCTLYHYPSHLHLQGSSRHGNTRSQPPLRAYSASASMTTSGSWSGARPVGDIEELRSRRWRLGKDWREE